MSRIVAFRERVMTAIAERVEALSEVNWYDGIFDEDDLKEWSHNVPAAYVAVMNAPTEHHSTGELNTTLRCVAVIIDHDANQPRDADERVWGICETVADFANLNKFGDPDAGAATRVRFQRMVHPELRREGVAVGIVEWETTITIGRNRFAEREYVYLDGQRVLQVPGDLFLGTSLKDAAGRTASETTSSTTDETP